MKMEFERYQFNIMKLITICSFVILGWQIIMLGYINLTQMQYHIGFDSSSFYLKATQMWEQKTLFCENWMEQTNLYLDTSAPLAALIYGVTKNIFFSYGLANYIVDLALLIILWKIFKQLNVSKLASLVCLNLLICPYFPAAFNNANDVGYAASVLTSGNWYGVRMLILLLSIKIVLDLEENKKNISLIIFTSILVFLSGLSSGYYILVTVFMPILVFYIIKMFVENNICILCNIAVLFAGLESCLIIIGKIVAKNVLGFVSIDSNMVLVGLLDFWKNIGSIFVGFIQLLAGLGLNSDVEIFTPEGISYVLGFGIFVICMIAVVYFAVTVCKNSVNSTGYMIAFIIMCFNILMFSVVYTTYGEPIFEIRYLTSVYIVILFLVAYYINSLSDSLLWKRFGIIVLLVCIAGKSYFSYGFFNSNKIDYDIINPLIDSIHEEESPMVYVFGSSIAIEGRNLRVMDLERIYKCLDKHGTGPYHWGDYTYYDENGEWIGPTVLLTTQTEFPDLPQYIQQLYEFKEEIGNFSIYTSEVNRFDFLNGIITDDINIDYPNTPGVYTGNGDFDENAEFVSNGDEAYILWGPNDSTEIGTYNFTLNYEVLYSEGQKAGTFDVCLNHENTIAISDMDADSNSITLENVKFESDEDTFEYRCHMNKGSIVKIKSIVIQKAD